MHWLAMAHHAELIWLFPNMSQMLDKLFRMLIAIGQLDI